MRVFCLLLILCTLQKREGRKRKADSRSQGLGALLVPSKWKRIWEWGPSAWRRRKMKVIRATFYPSGLQGTQLWKDSIEHSSLVRSGRDAGCPEILRQNTQEQNHVFKNELQLTCKGQKISYSQMKTVHCSLLCKSPYIKNHQRE